MDDATLAWVNEVNNTTGEAESLQSDIDRLQYELQDLVHSIRDLGMVRFADDVEDYTIREHARGLWDTVSGAASSIRSKVQDVASDVSDLRRAIEFYNR